MEQRFAPESQDAHERLKEPLTMPIPEGTVTFDDADEHAPVIFGVREILKTSTAPTLLVRYGRGSVSDDIRVRMDEERVDANTLNRIRDTLKTLLEALAQHESVPEIMAPVDDLEEALRILNRAQLQRVLRSEPQRKDTIAQLIEKLGVLTEDLQRGGIRTLKDIMSDLKALLNLGVIYVSYDGKKIETEKSFYHYLKKLEVLEGRNN